jgi:hypothetical protein
MDARRAKRRKEQYLRANQFKSLGLRGYGGPSNDAVPSVRMLDLPEVTEVEVLEFAARERMAAKTHEEEREAASKKTADNKRRRASSTKLNQRIVARDTALRASQEKERLEQMTPAQRERERLYFADKRKAATARYEAEQSQLDAVSARNRAAAELAAQTAQS